MLNIVNDIDTSIAEIFLMITSQFEVTVVSCCHRNFPQDIRLIHSGVLSPHFEFDDSYAGGITEDCAVIMGMTWGNDAERGQWLIHWYR